VIIRYEEMRILGIVLFDAILFGGQQIETGLLVNQLSEARPQKPSSTHFYIDATVIRGVRSIYTACFSS